MEEQLAAMVKTVKAEMAHDFKAVALAITEKFFVAPASDGQTLEVIGKKVIARNYVPEGELWCVDKEGNVVQKLILLKA